MVGQPAVLQQLAGKRLLACSGAMWSPSRAWQSMFCSCHFISPTVFDGICIVLSVTSKRFFLNYHGTIDQTFLSNLNGAAKYCNDVLVRWLFFVWNIFLQGSFTLFCIGNFALLHKFIILFWREIIYFATFMSYIWVTSISRVRTTLGFELNITPEGFLTFYIN